MLALRALRVFDRQVEKATKTIKGKSKGSN
jgi:hypothetical protein